MTYNPTDTDDDGTVDADVDNQNTTTQTLDTESVETTVPPAISSTRSRLPKGHYQDRQLTQNFGRRPSQTVCSWLFDDARISQYEFRDLFQNKDVQVSLSISTSQVGTTGRMSWEQINELASEPYNWEILSHGVSNTAFSNRTKSEKIADVYDSMATFVQKAKEFQNPDLIPRGYVYVGGETGGDEGQGIVSEVYDYAITAGRGAMDNDSGPYNLPRQPGDSTTESTITTEIDNAVSANSGIMIMGHTIIDGVQSDETGLEIADAKIDSIIDYGKNNTGGWGTVSDTLTNSKGVWQVGTFDGRIYQRADGKVVTELASGATYRVENSDGTPAVTFIDGSNVVYTPDSNVLFQPSSVPIFDPQGGNSEVRSNTFDFTDSSVYDDTADSMTANPEADTESGYVEVLINGSRKQIPLYDP